MISNETRMKLVNGLLVEMSESEISQAIAEEQRLADLPVPKPTASGSGLYATLVNGLSSLDQTTQLQLKIKLLPIISLLLLPENSELSRDSFDALHELFTDSFRDLVDSSTATQIDSLVVSWAESVEFAV